MRVEMLINTQYRLYDRGTVIVVVLLSWSIWSSICRPRCEYLPE